MTGFYAITYFIVFGLVMSHRPDLARRLVIQLTGYDPGELTVIREASCTLSPDKKEIRADALLENSSIRIDMEMQMYDEPDLFDRFVQDMHVIQAEALEKGAPYSQIKNYLGIVICKKMPEGYDEPIYITDLGMTATDGKNRSQQKYPGKYCGILYVNLKAIEKLKNTRPALYSTLQYFKDRNAQESALAREMEAEVKRINEGGHNLMTWEEIEKHIREEGQAIGEEKGKAEGKEEMIRNLNTLDIPAEKIALAADMTVEQVMNILNRASLKAA